MATRGMWLALIGAGLSCSPALAAVTPIPVAEPGSLTLLAVAAAAGVLLHRFRIGK